VRCLGYRRPDEPPCDREALYIIDAVPIPNPKPGTITVFGMCVIHTAQVRFDEHYPAQAQLNGWTCEWKVQRVALRPEVRIPMRPLRTRR
jgi:hypothetical protein